MACSVTLKCLQKKKYDMGNAYYEMLSKKYVNYVIHDVKYILK